METIARKLVIDAPAEKVFAYLGDPTNLPEIWPSMVAVTDVEELPEGGDRYHWVYKMAGTRFEGDSKTVEFEPNKHLVQENTGEIPGKFHWTFTPENGTTRIEMKVEYALPKTLLAKLGERFILKLNEREADMVLANLKDRVET
jgi:uncharacterized membrane protein